MASWCLISVLPVRENISPIAMRFCLPVVQLSIILHVLFAKAIFWCWHATTSREVVDGWNRCVKSCRIALHLAWKWGQGAPRQGDFEDLILHWEPQSKAVLTSRSCADSRIGVDKAMIIKAALPWPRGLWRRDHQSGGSWSVQSKWLNIYGSACVLRRWSVCM